MTIGEMSDRAINCQKRVLFWLRASFFVFRRALLRGVLVGLACFAAWLWFAVDRASFGIAWSAWRAEAAVASGFPEKRETIMDFDGRVHRMTAAAIRANPAIRKTEAKIRAELVNGGMLASVPALLVFAGSTLLTLREIRR